MMLVPDLRDQGGGNPRAYRNKTDDLWSLLMALWIIAAGLTLFATL